MLKFAEIQISNFVRQKIRFEIFLLGVDYMDEANRTSTSERGLVPSLARNGFYTVYAVDYVWIEPIKTHSRSSET